jgi:hypothetical protein
MIAGELTIWSRAVGLDDGMAMMKTSRYCSPCCPLRSTLTFSPPPSFLLLGTALGEVTSKFLAEQNLTNEFFELMGLNYGQ